MAQWRATAGRPVPVPFYCKYHHRLLPIAQAHGQVDGEGAYTPGDTSSLSDAPWHMPLGMDPLLAGFNPGHRLLFVDQPSPDLFTSFFCQLWGDNGGGVGDVEGEEEKEEEGIHMRTMGMKEGAVQRFPRRGRGGMAWLSMVHPRPRPRPRMHPRMKGRRSERGSASGCVSD